MGLAILSAALSVVGMGQLLAGWALTARFAAQPPPRSPAHPAISVLKPLHGPEPLQEEALTSVCTQDYPDYQIVFGVQRADDPAIPVVQRLQARFPDRDIVLVQDPTFHGENRKVGNLINMLASARHDVLVIADSDLHVQPDYLRDLAATLALPGVGLVTTLYAGLPAMRAVPALLGATQITHGFLPGALLARAMGRQDCLGATMCLRRETLTRIGGFHALVDHLADDNVLGRLVAGLGLKVALAGTVPATTVPEATMRALFRHELRWARTIRALEPGAFAGSALQYPLFWAALAIVLSGGTIWSVGMFALAWVFRAAAGTGIDRALAPKLQRLAFGCPVWLLPGRDVLSIVVMLASYAGKRVDWRGYTLQAAAAPPATHPAPFRRAEGLTQQ